MNLLICLLYSSLEELVRMYLIASPIITPLRMDLGWLEVKWMY